MTIQGNWNPIKGSIGKPESTATDNDRVIVGGMPGTVGAKPRRALCASIQVPVEITIRNSAGEATIYRAKAILVNQRGARFECTQRCERQPFKLDNPVWVVVRSNGQASGGKVIWSDSHPNRDGNFEFVAILDKPSMFADVTLQPHRGEEPKEAGQPEAAQSRLDYVPTSDVENLVLANIRAKYDPNFEFVSGGGDSAGSVPDKLSLNTSETPTAGETISGPFPVANMPLRNLESDSIRPVAEAIAAETTAATGADPLSPKSSGEPEPAAAPSSHQSVVSGLQDGRATTTGQLAEVIKLIESAVKMDSASECLVKEIRDQIAETQQAALASIAQRAQSLGESQNALLEARAKELAAKNQQMLENGFRRLAEAGEQGSKRLQEESMALFDRLEDLRKEIADQAAKIRDQLLQECRTRTDHFVSATLETARHMLSGQMNDMAKKIGEGLQRILAESANQLEKRFEKKLAEAANRLEEQMENSARDVHTAFVQKVAYELEELNNNQKAAAELIQQQIGIAGEQNLAKLQGGLTQMLQGLAELSRSALAPASSGRLDTLTKLVIAPAAEDAVFPMQQRVRDRDAKD